MSLVTTNQQAPTETMPRSVAIENEISVLSSRRFKRAQVIAITVIASGVVLLVVAITAPLVSIEGTRGIPENKPAGGKQDMSTETATTTTSTTSTASTTPTTMADIYSWSGWGSWMPHNATCGHQRRMRKCRSLRTKNAGTSCSGTMMQTRKLTLCRDCKEWYQSGGSKTNGVYTIHLDGRGPPFHVYCDMTTDGGGWTVFQRRQDGSEDFFRNWTEYKTGFGNLTGEFWLGNDKIHRLTFANESSLRVDLEDWNSNRKYAKYRRFKVASDALNYRLQVEGYSGTAGDSLARAHHRMSFSTKDRDNDEHPGNCAVDCRGAWWYNDCHDSNLNGLYAKEYRTKAVTWYGFNSSLLPLKFTEMKLRAT